MKNLAITASLALSAGLAQAQTQQWTIDAAHAKIGFTVSHFGISETDGRFTKFDGWPGPWKKPARPQPAPFSRPTYSAPCA